MSLSAIAASIFSPQQSGAASNPYQKQIQQLSQDLQSSNLSAAQSDFATLQQAFSQPSTTTSNSTSTSGTSSGTSANTLSPLSQAFNQLAADLQSGNLSAAQKDLSTVQQDIQSQGAHFGHHRHIGGGGATSASQTSQAYALQQQLQQFATGGGALTTEAAALQDQPPLSLVA